LVHTTIISLKWDKYKYVFSGFLTSSFIKLKHYSVFSGFITSVFFGSYYNNILKGVTKMIEDGIIGGGMILKVNCCIRSLAQGVKTASIIDGRVPHSLLLEILTDEGAGTMITG